MHTIPYIKEYNGYPTLFVKDEPFFCLAGELHNSSSSNLDYMAQHVWPALRGLNMNSVIAPIFWETIEPVEGQYDFTLLDGMIRQAREEGMHLILLWFGLWKNSESMYVPGWMKKDTKTYYRVENAKGQKINTISPLCTEAIAKDAKAFKAIMAHIKEVDEAESTVIVMQIENEIGVLKTPRDYSAIANEVFFAPIPADMAAIYPEVDPSLNWKDAFGKNAEEYFMAYHYAKAVETITKAGREEYPLPCYANAWLYQYPWYPGSYPCGGPVVQVHKIWKALAPSLFTLGPDIYVPYVPSIMDEYAYEGNPLFIPEVRKDAVTAAYCLYAFAKHNAICYSPFGIEEITLPPEAIDKPPMELMIALNIDPSAFDIAGSHRYLSRSYELIENLKPLLLEYRGKSSLQSYVRHSETDFGTFLEFQEYDVQVAYAPRMPQKPVAGGMIFELTPNKFLLVGTMANMTFMPKPGEDTTVELIKMEEGNIVNGQWVPGRILNGDEKMMVRHQDMPSCLMVEFYKY